MSRRVCTRPETTNCDIAALTLRHDTTQEPSHRLESQRSGNVAWSAANLVAPVPPEIWVRSLVLRQPIKGVAPRRQGAFSQRAGVLLINQLIWWRAGARPAHVAIVERLVGRYVHHVVQRHLPYRRWGGGIIRSGGVEHPTVPQPVSAAALDPSTQRSAPRDIAEQQLQFCTGGTCKAAYAYTWEEVSYTTSPAEPQNSTGLPCVCRCCLHAATSAANSFRIVEPPCPVSG